MFLIAVLKLAVAALKHRARAVKHLDEKKQGADVVYDIRIEAEDPLVAQTAAHGHCCSLNFTSQQ